MRIEALSQENNISLDYTHRPLLNRVKERRAPGSQLIGMFKYKYLEDILEYKILRLIPGVLFL